MSLSPAVIAAATQSPRRTTLAHWLLLLVAPALLTGCETTLTGSLLDAPASQAERAVGQKGDSWLTLGKRLLNAAEYDLAIDAFQRSLLIEGSSAEAMTGAGLAAEKQGLLTMAARYFERAREIAPNSEVAHNNLGVVLFRLKEYYRARQAFQAAFALSDGRNDLALRNLRLVEKIINDIEAGKRYVDPAVNMEVRRLGTYEFELIDYEPPEPDFRIGEPEQPAEDESAPEEADAPPGT